MISWKVSKFEQALIQKITDRAVLLADVAQIEYPARDVMMDITACHANGCRLKLAELLEAEQFDFVHDVFGIRRHLNRETGKLEDCFTPRLAA